MATDTYLVIGIIIGVLTIPTFLNAFSGSGSLRTPAIMVMIAGSLIVLAVAQKPGGYRLQDVPTAFVTVFGKLVR